jgi:hypothetical protein
MIRRIRTAVLVPAFVLAAGIASAQSLTLAANTNFQDVAPASGFFTMIQLAKRVGLAIPSSMGACLDSGTSTSILQPPVSGGVASPAATCPYFGPDDVITRAEMAYWIIRSQADETEISAYLCATGGDPTGLAGCNGGLPASTFGDLGAAGALIQVPFAGVSNAQMMRYVEVMARRGYTKGCGGTADTVLRYCPNDPVNRAQMAVFIIRAKMNNVFPTTLSGIPLATPYGDNFGVSSVPYFNDVTPSDPVWGPYFIYVQKMRELGITSGTGPGTYSPGNNVTRKEIATFAVKAFFL